MTDPNKSDDDTADEQSDIVTDALDGAMQAGLDTFEAAHDFVEEAFGSVFGK